MIVIQNESMMDCMRHSYGRDDVDRLLDFLNQQGTFDFRSKENGLFPAVSSVADNDSSGYQNAWVRDNVHIAHAHFVWGDKSAAAKTARALMRFMEGQRPRMQRIVRHPSRARDPMKRPHIRFDVRNMRELAEKWPHAQNDALGSFLWFFCKMAREGIVDIQDADLQTLSDLVLYLRAIEYWQDGDSGHWEEIRKVSASSIGAVAAGLRECYDLFKMHHYFTGPVTKENGIDEKLLNDLISAGEEALHHILPHECIGPGKKGARRYDAALLFLIYPLNIVSPTTASIILDDVSQALQGRFGIRRYLGDSYWRADYRDIFPLGDRSPDPRKIMRLRNRHIKSGEEAQWCLFDPIISCIHGMRALTQEGGPEDRALQTHYLNRSLGQLTQATGRVPAFSCPEAYFLEHGVYVPNDNTPLQWTQANLRMALHWQRVTAQL